MSVYDIVKAKLQLGDTPVSTGNPLPSTVRSSVTPAYTKAVGVVIATLGVDQVILTKPGGSTLKIQAVVVTNTTGTPTITVKDGATVIGTYTLSTNDAETVIAATGQYGLEISGDLVVNASATTVRVSAWATLD